MVVTGVIHAVDSRCWGSDCSLHYGYLVVVNEVVVVNDVVNLKINCFRCCVNFLVAVVAKDIHCFSSVIF